MTARKVTVKTPLAADKLIIQAATIKERLGEPFEIDVQLLSPDESVSFDAVLGKPLTIGLELDGGGKRYFHGYVAGFAQEGRLESYVTYRAQVVSWLWFLSRAVNCRIFQKRDVDGECTVPNIVKKVFRDHGFSDIKDTLTGTYRAREYCVQYGESDLNFVQRLLQEEGIYYYFTHTEQTHTLVLADDYSGHQPFSGYASIPYYPPTDNDVRETDHINDWHWARRIQPGKYVTTDYDFTKPRAVLQTQHAQAREIPNSSYEVFEYPGKYSTVGEGDHYARVRLEGMQASYERVSGSGNARGVAVGSLFKLTNYPRSDQNREYLVVSATHRLDAGTHESGVVAAHDDCVTTFEASESKQPFRSPITAFKTRVTGPQTAMVVGPDGEEIHTDKYGRVKLKFHWDRDPRRDENSSCWVRVSQAWAGKGWGGVSIPRIGQEVIVDYLEGDPDQPLITGRVYNQDSMPPFELPGSGVVSGIKSQTHKGSGFNEFSMNDTAGKEMMNIHAQFDQSTTVQHDQTNEIKNNRTSHVIVDDTLNVDANRTMNVKGKLAQKIDTGSDLTITAGHTQTISGGATSTINDGDTSTINAGATHTINGGLTQNVTGGATRTVDGGQTLTVTGPNDIHATGEGTYTSDARLTMGVGGSTVEVTSSSITINAAGSVVKIDATGVSINGAKISLNG